MRKLQGFAVGLSVILFLTASVYAEELTGRDIMLMVDDRPVGKDNKSLTSMTLVNKRGRTRQRSMRVIKKKYGDDSKSIISFLEPADVKGIGFLAWEYDNPEKEDDRWLYLPALKKSRRIAGSSKNDFFMGSDFTYDDMGDRNVDEDTHKLLRTEKQSDHLCWVIESSPREDNPMYSKVIHWIDQNALVSVKSEYYDRQGQLLKIFTVKDLKMHQKYWTIFEMEMENVQESHKTILAINEVEYNVGVKDNLFRVQILEKGRL